MHQFDKKSFLLGYTLLFGVILFLGNGCITSSADRGGGDSPIAPMYGVLLDPGHGGEPQEAAEYFGERFTSLGKGAKQGYREECYGAINASGYKEKTATLKVAKKVKSLLEEAGIQVDMTRSTDTYMSLDDRATKILSSKYRDWIFVSIHFNRSSSKQQARGLRTKYQMPRGFEIYVLPRRGERSTMGSRPTTGYSTTNNTRSANRLLAESIETHLRAIPGIHSRGIKEAWFVVLRESPIPGVLIECGFLSNPEEGILIETEGYQSMLARAIVAGIQDYRKRVSNFAEK